MGRVCESYPQIKVMHHYPVRKVSQIITKVPLPALHRQVAVQGNSTCRGRGNTRWLFTGQESLPCIFAAPTDTVRRGRPIAYQPANGMRRSLCQLHFEGCERELVSSSVTVRAVPVAWRQEPLLRSSRGNCEPAECPMCTLTTERFLCSRLEGVGREA